MKWAIKQHRDLAEDDLDELQAEHWVVIRQSKEVHGQKYDQKEIAMLNKRLDQAKPKGLIDCINVLSKHCDA